MLLRASAPTRRSDGLLRHPARSSSYLERSTEQSSQATSQPRARGGPEGHDGWSPRTTEWVRMWTQEKVTDRRREDFSRPSGAPCSSAVAADRSLGSAVRSVRSASDPPPREGTFDTHGKE